MDASQRRSVVWRLDPAHWPLNLALGVVLIVIALFSAVVWLSADVAVEKAVLWIGFPVCLTIFARTSGFHAREVAILVIPATIALIAVDVALHGPVRVVAELVVIFGALTPTFSTRVMVTFLTAVARTRYGKLPEQDWPLARAIGEANEAIGGAYDSDSDSLFEDAVDNAYGEVNATPAPDKEWTEVKRLYLEYLDWFRTPIEGEPTMEDELELKRLRDAARTAYDHLASARLRIRLPEAKTASTSPR